MVNANWEKDRILLTPSNLYMEYILLRYNNFLKEKLENIPITHGELTYIYHINYMGSISQTDLADLLWVSQANVTKMVKKLEKKGFLKREQDEKKKCKKIISLTENGREVYEQINQITLEWENDLSKIIPPEDFKRFKLILYTLADQSTVYKERD